MHLVFLAHFDLSTQILKHNFLFFEHVDLLAQICKLHNWENLKDPLIALVGHGLHRGIKVSFRKIDVVFSFTFVYAAQVAHLIEVITKPVTVDESPPMLRALCLHIANVLVDHIKNNRAISVDVEDSLIPHTLSVVARSGNGGVNCLLQLIHLHPIELFNHPNEFITCCSILFCFFCSIVILLIFVDVFSWEILSPVITEAITNAMNAFPESPGPFMHQLLIQNLHRNSVVKKLCKVCS